MFAPRRDEGSESQGARLTAFVLQAEARAAGHPRCEVASVFFLLAPPLADEDRGCQDGEPKHYQQQEADK